MENPAIPSPNLDSFNINPPPPITICILIVGTRGDVQPFIAIGKILKNDGHRVRLATHSVFRQLVTQHGLEFYPIAGDPKQLAAYMIKTKGHLIPYDVESLTTEVPQKMQMIHDIIHSTWPAVTCPDPDAHGKGVHGQAFRAQALISNPPSYGHIHVAEKLHIPLHIMFPQPWVPTSAFPHPFSNLPYTRQMKPQKRNYLSYKIFDLLMWQSSENMINDLRKNVLHLGKIRTGDGGKDLLLTSQIPHAFLWSPSILPKPNDWGSLYDVVGTVLLHPFGSSTYTPSKELQEFIDKDPIFIGFGSMILPNPIDTLNMIIDAAVASNTCIIIQYDLQNLSINIPTNIHFIGDCPHDWLFLRVRAVVHHGGAGTTAAGVLAGKPTFILPFFGDQSLWGRAVVLVGVGIEPCPIASITTEIFIQAFQSLSDPQLQQRCKQVQQEMLRENGAKEAVHSFYRHLPIPKMMCQVAHQQTRIASRYDTKTDLRLCDECAFVISQLENVSVKDIKHCFYVDYTAHGPDSELDGLSSGAGAFFHEIGSSVKSMFSSPVNGYREEGTIGAIVGLAKGVAGMFAGPFSGLAVLADHVATGHYNRNTEKRIGSYYEALETQITEWRHARTAIQANESVNGAQVKVVLSNEDIIRLQNQFLELLQQRTSQEIQTQSVHTERKKSWQRHLSKKETRTEQIVHAIIAPGPNTSIQITFRSLENHFSAPETMELLVLQYQSTQALQLKKVRDAETHIPMMNICMITCGSWDDQVYAFAALGQELLKRGHCVRIAAALSCRDQILALNLDFVALQGSESTVPNFLHAFLQSKSSPGFSRLHRTERVKQAQSRLENQIFSYLDAAYDQDTPFFRADVLIAHPFCFGVSIVAERLGIPLQYLSDVPTSPTAAFPHVFATFGQLTKEYNYMCSNVVSYRVIAMLLYDRLRGILDRFRDTIGLKEKSDLTCLHPNYHVPIMYTWSCEIMKTPMDWGHETQAIGFLGYHSSVTDEHFALRESDIPVILYVARESTCKAEIVNKRRRIIDDAAKKANVCVLLADDGDLEWESEHIQLLPSHISISIALEKAQALVNTSHIRFSWNALAVGKPCATMNCNYKLRFWARKLANLGVGLQMSDAIVGSSESLFLTFSQLLSQEMMRSAQDMACKLETENAAQNGCAWFYANLPLRAMRCDVDPNRLARVYDPVHELKLSYEAQVAVQAYSAPSNHPSFKYKPIWYRYDAPPKFLLSAIPGYPYRISPKPNEILEIQDLTFLDTKVLDSERKEDCALSLRRRPTLQTQESLALDVVNMSLSTFWSSAEEEIRERERIRHCYKELRDQKLTV